MCWNNSYRYGNKLRSGTSPNNAMPWQLRNSCGTHSLERFIISEPLASIQSCWWVTGEVECCWMQFGCNEWTKSPDATTTCKLKLFTWQARLSYPPKNNSSVFAVVCFQAAPHIKCPGLQVPRWNWTAPLKRAPCMEDPNRIGNDVCNL